MVVNFDNGYLKVNTPEAEEMLEELLDKDIFWEYLSIAFQKSVEQDLQQKKEDERIESLMAMMKGMQANFESLEKTVKEAPRVVETVVASSGTATKPVEGVKKPPQRQRKKVDMNKLNAKGSNNPFLAMAAKAGSMK